MKQNYHWRFLRTYIRSRDLLYKRININPDVEIVRWNSSFKITPCLQHPLPSLGSQHGLRTLKSFLLFYVKNSIYCPLNSLTINWCLITYVAAARERDKYAAEPVTDSLKNEREKETKREDSHIRQHLTATAASRSSFIGPHIAETVSVPKTLRVTLRTDYCWQTGLTGHASPIRVVLIILGYGAYTRTDTNRHL